jgi:hypothetical protein
MKPFTLALLATSALLLTACDVVNPQGAKDEDFGPGAEAWPFDNENEKALQALTTHIYTCWDQQEDRWTMTFNANGALLLAYLPENTVHPGTWSQDGTTINLSVPELSFNQNSSNHIYKLDELAEFKTPALECNLISLGAGSGVNGGVFECPSINFVEGAGFDHYRFELFNDSGVIMKRFEEITIGDGDTLIYTRTGFYKILDEIIYFYIAFDEVVSLIWGPINGANEFSIEQLEPERGDCTAS